MQFKWKRCLALKRLPPNHHATDQVVSFRINRWKIGNVWRLRSRPWSRWLSAKTTGLPLLCLYVSFQPVKKNMQHIFGEVWFWLDLLWWNWYKYAPPQMFTAIYEGKVMGSNWYWSTKHFKWCSMVGKIFSHLLLTFRGIFLVGWHNKCQEVTPLFQMPSCGVITARVWKPQGHPAVGWIKHICIQPEKWGFIKWWAEANNFQCCPRATLEIIGTMAFVFERKLLVYNDLSALGKVPGNDRPEIAAGW